jgi:polyphosphate glucokinase
MRAPRRVLVVDIGASHVKVLVSGETEPRRFKSGSALTPQRLVQETLRIARGWNYDVISIGYPGRVGSAGPQSEHINLGRGWVGFDFRAAFGCPVRVINDAAMQALGSYDGRRMLFLGLGTGLGSTLIIDGLVIPLELGELPIRRRKMLGELLGDAGRRSMGKRAWRKEVSIVTHRLSAAFSADYVVLGGGNAKLLNDTRSFVRLGNNLAAFLGGERLWTGVEADDQEPQRHSSFGSCFLFQPLATRRDPRVEGV